MSAGNRMRPQCAHFPVSFESTRDSESPATGIAGAGACTQYISAICAVKKCSGGTSNPFAAQLVSFESLKTGPYNPLILMFVGDTPSKT